MAKSQVKKVTAAPAPAPATAATGPAAPADGILYVRDILVGDTPRIHQLRDARGKPVPFVFKSSQEDVAMPADIALPLVHMPEGFEVRREIGGSPLRPMTRKNGAAMLQANETIATYSELKLSSLIKRVELLGYDVDRDKVTENELVTILLGGIAEEEEDAIISDEDIESTVIPEALLKSDPLINQFEG